MNFEEMENLPVGFRFNPTDVELVNNYLRPKNLNEDTSKVDRVINTVNMSSFDPWKLAAEAKIRDEVLFFFCRIEKKYKKGDQQIRKTKSGIGFWKKTGKTGKIKNRSGKQIGEKRVLMYYFNKNKSKTKWVMHEYHLSPLDQNMSYTVCKVEFKGAESERSSPPCNETSHSSVTDMNNSGPLSSGSEVGQSQNLAGFEFQSLQNPRQLSGYLHPEEDAQRKEVVDKANSSVPNDESNNMSFNEDDWNSYFNDLEQSTILSVQEDCSIYTPKPSVTSIMIDHTSDDSDSDSVSTTTISIQTVSTCDSFGSSNHRIELQESPNSTIKLVPITQEVSQTPGPVTETGEHKLGQVTIKKKRDGSFYRMIHRLFKKINLCCSNPRT